MPEDKPTDLVRTLTDIELERHLAGELPAARFAAATDADRTRLGELRADAEAFLRSVDVDMEVRRIQQRIERSRPQETSKSWLRWFVPASALAAAAAVILVVIKRGNDSPEGLRLEDETQVKGDEISLVVHRQAPGGRDGSTRLSSGDPVQAGDRLRFEINAGKPGFVAVVGIDGSGKASIYYPDADAVAGGRRTPTPFDPAQRLLPGAIELDATPGDERFFALYAERPFSLDVVVPALSSKAALPPEISSSEIVLRKK